MYQESFLLHQKHYRQPHLENKIALKMLATQPVHSNTAILIKRMYNTRHDNHREKTYS